MNREVEVLIGAAKLYLEALAKRGAARTSAESEAAIPVVLEACERLQVAVTEISVVAWLARLDEGNTHE